MCVVYVYILRDFILFIVMGRKLRNTNNMLLEQCVSIVSSNRELKEMIKRILRVLTSQRLKNHIFLIRTNITEKNRIVKNNNEITALLLCKTHVICLSLPLFLFLYIYI